MKTAVKFLVSLALALLLAWAVRTYAFTVFTVPSGGLPPQLKEGNRVIVNRIDCDVFKRGETVVFADSLELETSTVVSSYTGRPVELAHPYTTWEEENFIGQIVGMPGDVICIKSRRYVIPIVCCDRCGCKDCRYYLVRTSRGKQLVHKHQILGKAYKIF